MRILTRRQALVRIVGLCGAALPLSRMSAIVEKPRRRVELQLLGSAILAEPVIRYVLIPLQRSLRFRDQANRTIFEAIVALHCEGKPVDLVVLADKLSRDGQLRGVGGSEYLSELVASLSTQDPAYFVRLYNTP